jgi:hypothetical protein
VDTVAIVACFNFSSSVDRERSLVAALSRLSGKVDIILVSTQQCILGLSDIENLKIIQIPYYSVLWQKERFYNIALSYIKDCHKYLLWIDGDVLFIESSWLKNFKKQMEHFRLVQLYHKVVDVKYHQDRYIPNGTCGRSVIEGLKRDNDFKRIFQDSRVKTPFNRTGFAWGSRTEFILNTGFPDMMILGGGDRLLLAASMGYHDMLDTPLNSSMRNICMIWAKKFFNVIKGQVSYIENTIHHCMQGDYKNRKYFERHNLICKKDFVISNYLKLNEYGAWEWKNPNNKYARVIKSYFTNRGD